MSAFPQCPHTGDVLEEERTGFRTHASDGSLCYGQNGRILQITPATGWRGIYADEENGKAVTSESPVACFALVELCDGLRLIEPYMAHWDEIDRAYSCSNFRGVLGPGETAGEWVQRDAEEYCARQRAKKEKPKAIAS